LVGLANRRAFLDNNRWDILDNHNRAILLRHRWDILDNLQWVILHLDILHLDIRHNKVILHLVVFRYKYLALVSPFPVVESM